ncbi:hypothetical protein PRZ48_014616 [Zasmidium cellare]|uniref:Gag protein n=1 Tax=Zasmidium cellare TaxID=395010 RepID=A0ABR0DZA8_ZASCE|nr:hypothetical protein PRZ48_014616 [Zasmidium cellare]
MSEYFDCFTESELSGFNDDTNNLFYDDLESQLIHFLSEAEQSPEGPVQPEVPEISTILEPTIEPTAEPTTEPTIEPTIEPTVEPTVEPVVQPVIEPAIEPTAKPGMISPPDMKTPRPVQSFMGPDQGSLPEISANGLRFTSIADAQAFASARTPMLIPDDDYAAMEADPTLYIKKIMAAFNGVLRPEPEKHELKQYRIEDWVDYQVRNAERAQKYANQDPSLIEVSAWLLFAELLEAHKYGAKPIKTSTSVPAPELMKCSDHLNAIIRPISEYAIFRVDLLRLLRLDELVSNVDAAISRKLSNFKGNGHKADRDAGNMKRALEAGVEYDAVLGTKRKKGEPITGGDEGMKKIKKARKSQGEMAGGAQMGVFAGGRQSQAGDNNLFAPMPPAVAAAIAKQNNTYYDMKPAAVAQPTKTDNYYDMKPAPVATAAAQPSMTNNFFGMGNMVPAAVAANGGGVQKRKFSTVAAPQPSKNNNFYGMAPTGMIPAGMVSNGVPQMRKASAVGASQQNNNNFHGMANMIPAGMVPAGMVPTAAVPQQNNNFPNMTYSDKVPFGRIVNINGVFVYGTGKVDAMMGNGGAMGNGGVQQKRKASEVITLD